MCVINEDGRHLNLQRKCWLDYCFNFSLELIFHKFEYLRYNYFPTVLNDPDGVE